jgi:exosortase
MTSTPTNAESGAAAISAGQGADDLVLGIFTRRGLAITIALGAALVWLFWRWFEYQFRVSWEHMEDWGHSFVIPLISGYLLWQSRERIAKTDTRVFWVAIVPFLVGIQTYAVTLFIVSNPMLQGFSMILTLGSLVLLLTGPAMLRFTFLPVAYLILMVTIAESIMLKITFKLQAIATQGSWVMLNLIGEPFGWFSVDMDGNRLDILTSSGVVHPLNVAEACSGMRMVVAFYALAGAVALLGCSQWWQRIMLLLLAGPVAVFMNMIRVVVLGLLTLQDPDLAAGDAHTLIGTILLIPSLGLFIGIVWALNKIIGTNEPGAEGTPA